MEDRHEPGRVYSEEELLNFVTVTVNGNEVILENKAPQVISFWTTTFGSQSNKNTTTVYIPVANTYTATLKAFSAGGTTTVTKEFESAQNDPEYFANPMWNLLTNGEAGKTWVWANDIPGGKVWGNGGYLGNNAPSWWTLGMNDIISQGGDASDEITFNLDRGINFTVKTASATSVPGEGSGTFNMSLAEADQVKDDNGNVWSLGKIIFTNHSVPLGFEPNSPGKPLHYTFDILKLTEDELVLAFPEPGVTSAWGTAWFYMFKRKGYTY
jgi:hypothetical protein